MAALGATPLTLQPERLESRLHQPPRPNIVLILADDFPRAGTPRLRLAPAVRCGAKPHVAIPQRRTALHDERGLHDIISLCTPSRLAFMTGRYFI